LTSHWNKNVDREHTSVSNPQNARRPRSKRGKKTIRNSHSNLEIIFGNVLSIVCLEKETKGGTIRLFYLIMKADKYFQKMLVPEKSPGIKFVAISKKLEPENLDAITCSYEIVLCQACKFYPLKLLEDFPMIIPGQFGFNCPSGFREEAF
jgi:hypothetical protein